MCVCVCVVCVCVRACVRASVRVGAYACVHSREFVLTVFWFCFVMDYVLQFGETAYKRESIIIITTGDNLQC